MSELLQFDNNPWVAVLLLALVVLLVVLAVLFFRGRTNSLEKALAAISFDRLEGLVIPSADDGEIMVDVLLLTSKGLLVLELKDAQGIVFGGDKLQDWTVISDERRYTFSNPQPALYDRIAAVRQIVRQVPIAGRIVFPDGANFTKGVPGMVCSIDELVQEFGETDRSTAMVKIEAFKPHWDLIRAQASSGQSKALRSRGERI